MKEYVRTCERCQQTKTFPAKPFGTLQPNAVPTDPWEDISADLIMGLPESRGYTAILVVVDRLTKMIHLSPTDNSLNSTGLARLYLNNVWKLHGTPKRVISDRGPQFVSQFMRELLAMLGTTPASSTAHHPQTDGQTERIDQEVEQYLRLFTNYDQDDEVDWLPIAEYTYNNRSH